MTLEDGSHLELFRKNFGDIGVKLPNPLIRSTILSTLLTGEPDCYYKARGFVYSDVGAEKVLKAEAERVLKLNVGDILASERTFLKVDDAKGFLEGKSDEKEFHEVFRELHKGAEAGNNTERQILIDIVNGFFLAVPGNAVADDLVIKRDMESKL